VPLAVSSALWFSLSGFAGRLFSYRALPLCEFRFPPEYHPTDPSRPAEAFRLLSWASVPYGTDQDRRSTASRALPARFVPLQGLATLLTAFSLRSPAGFVSHRQRPWDLPFGASPPDRYPGVSTWMHPLTVQPGVVPSPDKSGSGRPVRPRFLGFVPARSPE
jgi:hypothetical protein